MTLVEEIKAEIATLPATEQRNIKFLAQVIREMVVLYGHNGKVAMCLVGAELQEEEENWPRL